jgi:hypothetical protein
MRMQQAGDGAKPWPYLEDYIWGQTRNTQNHANLVMVMTHKTPRDQRNWKQDGTRASHSDPIYRERGLVACGIALGQISLSAASMGYAIGYNTCFGHNKTARKQVMSLLQIPDHEELLHGLGIGFPQANRSHWESDDTVLQINEDGEFKQITLGEPFTYKGTDCLVQNTKVFYGTYSHIAKDIEIRRL